MNSPTPHVIWEGAAPTMLSVPQAARLLGIGRTLGYELVRTDSWLTPCERAA